MTQTFLIASLPRSGSCWLANALSQQPGVLCRHEAVGHHGAIGWYNPVSMVPYEAIGSVGSDLISSPMWQKYVPPQTHLFWLWRPLGEIRDSLERCGTFNEEAWDWQVEMAAQFLKLRPTILTLTNAVPLVMSRLTIPLDSCKLFEAYSHRVASLRWPDSRGEM